MFEWRGRVLLQPRKDDAGRLVVEEERTGNVVFRTEGTKPAALQHIEHGQKQQDVAARVRVVANLSGYDELGELRGEGHNWRGHNWSGLSPGLGQFNHAVMGGFCEHTWHGYIC